MQWYSDIVPFEVFKAQVCYFIEIGIFFNLKEDRCDHRITELDPIMNLFLKFCLIFFFCLFCHQEMEQLKAFSIVLKMSSQKKHQPEHLMTTRYCLMLNSTF